MDLIDLQDDEYFKSKRRKLRKDTIDIANAEELKPP